MRIAQLRTTIVAVPQLRSYKSSWRRSYQGRGAQCSVLVELDTDDGLVGIGESPVMYAGKPEVTTALIGGIRELLIGADKAEPRDLIAQIDPAIPSGSVSSIAQLANMRVDYAADRGCTNPFVESGSKDRGEPATGRAHHADARSLHFVARAQNVDSCQAVANHHRH